MYQPPYFIKKFISTNRSRVKDRHFLAQKQPKMDIFEKADYLGLKDPLEVWVHYEICNTICGIPVPTILNHKNSTGSAGEAKNSQNGVFLEVFWLKQIYRDIKFILRGLPERCELLPPLS